MQPVARTAARRRGALAGAVVALMVGSGVVGAVPASAASGTFVDEVGEVHASPDVDVTRYQVGLTTSALSVTIWTAGSATTPLRGDTTILVELETTGDETTDYTAYLVDGQWEVRHDDTFELACQVPAILTAGSAALTAPADCLGDPAQVRVAANLFGTDGHDTVPSNFLANHSAPVSSGPDTVPASAVQQPVFRFWSPAFDNAHFFTTGEAEAEHILFYDFNWTYEGVAFNALQSSGGTCETGTAVHRFWSPGFRSHFYTQSAAEKNHIVATDRNWTYEGVSYCAYPDPAPGSVPLHRFWSPGFGKHFFTASQDEADQIRAHDRNWVYEGVAYHVLP